MRGKNYVPEEDVEETIEEYKSVNTQSKDNESDIFYKGLTIFYFNLILFNHFQLLPCINIFFRVDHMKNNRQHFVY